MPVAIVLSLGSNPPIMREYAGLFNKCTPVIGEVEIEDVLKCQTIKNVPGSALIDDDANAKLVERGKCTSYAVKTYIAHPIARIKKRFVLSLPCCLIDNQS